MKRVAMNTCWMMLIGACTVVASEPHPRTKVLAKPKPLPDGAVTENWPCFLGPTHNGISRETRLLKSWPNDGPTLLWSLERGTGYTSPAIVGDRLVYFHRMKDHEVVECLHSVEARLFWTFEYPTAYRDRYGYNNGPRASPVIDGDRVYTLGAEGKLHCLSMQDGAVHWSLDLMREYELEQNFFGMGPTPLIEGDVLIVVIGKPGGPSLVGLDKLTGKERWRAGDQWTAGYASPIPADVHGRRRVFVFLGGDSRPPTGGLLAIDPADGQLDFEFPWRSDLYESVNASCPVIVGDQVFISASYDTGGAMLTLKPDGGFETAWTTPALGTHWNTAIHMDGYLYGFDGRHQQGASLVCIEAATGREMWRESPEWEQRFEQNGDTRTARFSTFRASLLAADGAYLCLAEMGHLLWLELTPKGYKELARTWLFAAPETWALPVLSKGLLYVVQNHRDMLTGAPPRVLCYDLRAPSD